MMGKAYKHSTKWIMYLHQTCSNLCTGIWVRFKKWSQTNLFQSTACKTWGYRGSNPFPLFILCCKNRVLQRSRKYFLWILEDCQLFSDQHLKPEHMDIRFTYKQQRVAISSIINAMLSSNVLNQRMWQHEEPHHVIGKRRVAFLYQDSFDHSGIWHHQKWYSCFKRSGLT